MAITRCTFKITGLSPLLMHNALGMKRAGGGLGTKKIPTAEDEAAAGVYRLPNGTLFIPAISFRSSIIGKGGSASGRKVGKLTAKVAASAALSTAAEFCELFDPETEEPITAYVIDSRRAVVQGNGIIRSRPRVDRWACDLVMDIDEDFLSVEHTVALLNFAGRLAGVLDFRPQCRGEFGKFRAELRK
jgi:hypothetical protein